MTRPIKFRTWSKNLEIYVGGILLDGRGLSYRLEPGPILVEDENDDYTVEQYTGFSDKNGKEMYEGDIVSVWGGKLGEVYFDDIDLQYRIRYGDGLDEGLTPIGEPEIVGNIHENAELLLPTKPWTIDEYEEI